MVKKKRLLKMKRKSKKMCGVVVDKLRLSSSVDRRRLTEHLNKLVKEDKINNSEYQRVTKGGLWRIYVDFKEVEDASEFLMKFWRLKYKKSKFI